jgi:hypothetical protein
MKEISTAIHQAKRRLRWNLFLRSLLASAIVLTAFLVIPAGVIKLWNLDFEPLHLLAFSFLSIPWALYRLWTAKITDTLASMEVDSRFHLKDRIASAWVLKEDPNPMVPLLETDAALHAKDLAIASRFPLEASRRAPWLGVPLGLFLAVCLWLPPLPLSEEEVVAKTATPEKLVDPEKAKQVAELLKPKVPEVKKAEKPEMATAEALLAPQITELGERIKKEKMTQKEALSALSDEQEKIRRKKDKLARAEEARMRLEKSQEPQKFTKDVRENVGKGEYAQAAENLEQLSEQITNGSLSKADASQLQKELESLAQQLDGNSELQAALKEAASVLREQNEGEKKNGQSLSEADRKKLLEALKNASMDLGDLQKLADNKQLMESTLENLDLAKLALSDGLSKCQSCGKICSATGGCSACKGNGPGQGSVGQGMMKGAGGQGMGGPGQGKGGAANRYEEPDVQLQDENISAPWHPGKPLGVVEVEAKDSPAVSTLGESVAILEAGEAEQSVVHEEIPPGYEDVVRGYFDRGGNAEGAK